ncbi:TRAP transporter small permease subunit [Oceanobacillus longus]|uniref:TRAP transporter small permease subunit n=1 Tax=Oceanobacillus longus TaxID=930120 RepID=A0ABV8GYT4_9BACI
MKNLIIASYNLYGKFNKILVYIAGGIVMLMSIAITIDVILRYFFSSPTSWIFNTSNIATGFVALILGGYMLMKDGHVRVDIFFEKFSLRTQSIIDLITTLFLFLIVFAFIWLGFDYVMHYMNIGATSSGGLGIPLWVYWTMIPIGGIILGIQGIFKLIEDIYIIINGEKLYGDEEVK